MAFLRVFNMIIAILTISVWPSTASTQSTRQQLTVPTGGGKILVESVGSCANAICPAVLILSGSRGFETRAYDEIGKTFGAAGLHAYLVHLLSPADLHSIASASSAQTRIAYYAQRLPEWTSSVQNVAAYINNLPHHGGKIGILGISLGAQIASAASIGKSDIDALVLVDAGLPNGYSHPIPLLPPLHLIWGSADATFPVAIGRQMQRMAQNRGGQATLDVYEGGAHDFFLRSSTRNAVLAHQSAADFLVRHLSQ